MFKRGFFTKLPVCPLQGLFKSFTLWQRLNSNSNPPLSRFFKVGFFFMLFNPSLAKHALSAVEGRGRGDFSSGASRLSRHKAPSFSNLPVIFFLALAFTFTGPALAADKLRIGYGAPSVAMSVLWITKEGKLFEKNNLEVEVLYLESALVQRALIAGNIDYGEMTGSLMAAPKLQGADLVMIAGFLNQLIYRLVTRPEIKTIADLKGKRVAVSRFGAGADRATRFLLTKLGFNPEKDVVLVQVGGAPTRLAALAANSIDATIVEPPDHKKAQEAGMRVLANMEDMGIPFQHTGLVTTRAHLAKSPDIARRVIKSFIEGIQLATVNSEIAKRALRKHMRLQQERDLDDAYQILRGFMPRKPYPTLDGFKMVFAELADQIPAAKTADPRDFVDTRLIEEFDRSGYIDGLYR